MNFVHFFSICQLLVILLIVVSNTTGQTPTVSVTPTTIEIGSNLTAICHVQINHAIAFEVDGMQVGSCPIPVGGLKPCSPIEIEQDVGLQQTIWTLPASTAYEGNWSCSRSLTGSSNIVVLQMFNCVDSALSENGINSDLALNDTSKVDITVETGCIYPSGNPEILLQFKSGLKQIDSIMNCNASGTVCTEGTSYECNHQIFSDMSLMNNGKFEMGINYTLHFKASPSIGDCNSVAIFDQYSLKFNSIGHISSTEEPIATPEQSSFTVSIPYTASAISNAIGSGKEVTETVISTNVRIATAETMVQETKNVFAPLVISVSVASFFFLVISLVVICHARYKRDKKSQKTSGNYSDPDQHFNEGHIHQKNNRNYLHNRNESTKNKFDQFRPSYKQHSHKHDKYENDNVIFYKGTVKREQTIEIVHEPFAYRLNEH